MDTHVMRMVRSWWSAWNDRREDPAAMVALADGIHRLIREAEEDTRRRLNAEQQAYRVSGEHSTLLADSAHQ